MKKSRATATACAAPQALLPCSARACGGRLVRGGRQSGAVRAAASRGSPLKWHLLWLSGRAASGNRNKGLGSPAGSEGAAEPRISNTVSAWTPSALSSWAPA